MNDLNYYLNEGKKLANKSTDPKSLFKTIVDKFNDIGNFDRPSGEFLETIDFTRLSKDNKKFFDFIDKNNWYVAKHNNQNKGELKPIYSIEGIRKMPKELLHATPTINVDNILKQGIVASSNDLRHKYPNRIYLASKLSTINQLIKEMKRYSGETNYSIFKIDSTNLDTVLYKDDTCSYSDCYYIQNYDIPSNKISLLNQ
tara:strand:+ start:38 stop:637 length:600 start_codon:yes stop_codon:yes gene_type:complete